MKIWVFRLTDPVADVTISLNGFFPRRAARAEANRSGQGGTEVDPPRGKNRARSSESFCQRFKDETVYDSVVQIVP